MKKLRLFSLFILVFSIYSCAEKAGYTYYNYSDAYYDAWYNSDYADTAKTPVSAFALEPGVSSFFNLKDSLDTQRQIQTLYSEELINYFPYNYEEPDGDKVFSVFTDVAVSPWNNQTKVVHIGLKAKTEKISNEENKSRNIVFVIDTSGSTSSVMDLIRSSLISYVSRNITENDRVSIVFFEDSPVVKVPVASGSQKALLLQKLNELRAGGGTNAWPAILQGYKIAEANSRKGDASKVVIISDGDFGGVNEGEFGSLIKSKLNAGISLSVIGYGIRANEISVLNPFIASKLITLNTINKSSEIRNLDLNFTSGWKEAARNLKVQVAFNTKIVKQYRLIGYEKNKKNDFISSGSLIPSGFTCTALYEIIPHAEASKEDEILSVKLNYSTASGKAEEVKAIVKNNNQSAWTASENLRFSTGVAAFAMVANNSKFKSKADYNMAIHLLQDSLDYDPDGSKQDFLGMVLRYKNR